MWILVLRYRLLFQIWVIRTDKRNYTIAAENDITRVNNQRTEMYETVEGDRRFPAVGLHSLCSQYQATILKKNYAFALD